MHSMTMTQSDHWSLDFYSIGINDCR